VILLYTYVNDPKYDAVRRRTEHWLWHHVDALTKSLGLSIWEWRVKPGDDLAYYWGLRAAWEEHRGVITLEQDILPTLQHFLDLVACPEEVCAVDFPLPWRERERVIGDTLFLGPPPPHLSNCRVKYEAEGRTQRFVTDVDEHADWWPLGLTKFSAETTKAVDFPNEPIGWQNLDTLLSDHVRERERHAHVHRPKAEHLRHSTEGNFRRIDLDYPYPDA
jgi:hypothetical protein